MTSCLKKRDEERMKKNVECMVKELKKATEEVKAEVVEVEYVKVKDLKVENVKIDEEEEIEEEVVVKEVAAEEQQVVEDEKKTESLTEVNNEISSASDKVGVERKQKDAD
ncbi:hypothetical protein Hanom_Chr07g00644061 [Helianthus anomalus]